MAKTIYVGNVPFTSTEEDITQLFEEHGEVHSVKLITDRETGRFRGFVFVEMEDDAANAAIDALNGANLGGRSLRVNEARERGAGGQRGSW